VKSIIFSLLSLSLFSSVSFSSIKSGDVALADRSNKDPIYWSTAERRIKPNRSSVYKATMHNDFPNIRQKYEENSEHYYSENINSFGTREVFDATKEQLFCSGSGRTFSETVLAASRASNASRSAYQPPHTYTNKSGQVGVGMGVRYDFGSFGLDQLTLDDQIGITLGLNSGSKGRFCKKINDPSINYRTANAGKQVYCDPSATESISFTDPVSGFSCAFELDIPLKVGETRFMRQLQGSFSTVAQGFIGCYQNEAGFSKTVLIDNPESCTSSNRETCIKSCDWALDVVCDPRDMPRWGAGKCAGIGTVIFKNDIITVDSTSRLSFDASSRIQYSGTAVMACSTISKSAQWVVTESSCSPVTP
jgi:hypothetical protein